MTKSYFLIGKYYSFYLLLSFLLVSSFVSEGQITSDINFTNFGHIENIPNQEIFSVIRDKNGFLWIGSTDGLFRYDAAYNMKCYRVNEPKIAGGLQSNFIRALYEDKNDNLWIGTTQGGLTKFHQPSGQWTTYMTNDSDPYSISSNEVLSIYEDSKGAIWVGTENGLNLLDVDSERFIRFMPDADNPDALSAKAVISIIEDDANRIWVSTWAGGINLFLPATDGNMEHSKLRSFYPSESKSSHNVWSIYQDPQKRFWLSTMGSGLFLMEVPESANIDPDHQIWEPIFHNIRHSKEHPKSISSNGIFNVLQDENGTFWVATNNGLNRTNIDQLPRLVNGKYNPEDIEKISFEVSLPNPKDARSIKNNVIYSIYEDTQNLLWFGLPNGVSQYNWYKNQFKTQLLFNPTQNSSNINDIYTSEDGQIWVATNNNGLLKYDFDTGKSVSINTSNEQSLLESHLRRLYSKDDRTLYVGSYEGIEIIDLETLNSKVILSPNWLKKKLPELKFNTIYLDSKNNLWLGMDVGLIQVDLKTNEFQYFTTNPNDQYSISDNSVNAITEDNSGSLWIGTYNGLNRLDLHQQGPIKFQQYKYKNNDPYSIPVNQVAALKIVDNTMLIGARGGMYIYDLNTERFSEIGKEFNESTVYGFEFNKNGNIWGATKSGLISLDLKTKQIKTYTNEKDLGGYVFTGGSSNNKESGDLYFASNWSITRCNPNTIKKNVQSPIVKITDYRKMSVNEEINESFFVKDELVLEHNDYYLSLNFAAQNYIDPDKNQYAYKLEGFDENWIYTNNVSSAVYTNLDHGTYTFRVKGSNNDGVWNEEGATVKIIKQAAYWETWWFQTVVSVFSCLLLFFGFKYYTYNVRQRNQELKSYNDNLAKEIKERKRIEKELQERDKYLEHLVDRRTKQLNHKNVEVNALLNKIKKRNDELEDIVAARTKKISDFNNELKRSNNDLEQFAYIASHDLQAPLRTIKSFSGLLGKSLADKMSNTDKDFLGFIDSSIGNMQELIDALLTFSKVNSQARKIQAVNPNKLLQTIQAELGAVMKEQNAVVELSDFPEAIHADRIKLKQLLQNLISNGIKFSKKGIAPVVKISCEDKEDCWQIEVKDNGIGISEDFREKIFLLFKRLHSSEEYKGTGIGLALCKKIVEQHGGEIWVESEEGKGSSFIFTIDKMLN